MTFTVPPFARYRPFDGLNSSPEVTVVIPQVAVPPSTRPRLDLHWERFSIVRLIALPDLLEQRRERRIQRRPHVDFLREVQCQIINTLRTRDHGSSLK